MKKLFLFPLLVILVIGFILTGCTGTSSPTTAPINFSSNNSGTRD